MSYDPLRIERTWRAAWKRTPAPAAPPTAPNGAQRYVVHDAAPFPNSGLHMGHVRTYVLGDLTARYQRACGRDVVYFTSFDAFGLPIELAAIQRKFEPRELVRQCAHRMTRQLGALAIGYDWSRVPKTCDPEYYRWTQWLFLEMFDAGLVERRAGAQPWCPQCVTTLARVQIEDDGCWRCASRVETSTLR